MTRADKLVFVFFGTLWVVFFGILGWKALAAPAALSACQNDLLRARAERTTAERALRDDEANDKGSLVAAQDLSGIDYILWEVHTLDYDPGHPRGDTEIAKLCDEGAGDHAALRLGTALTYHTIWNDEKGRIKLGCRYVRWMEKP